MRAYLTTAFLARLADEGVAVALALLALDRTGSPAPGAFLLTAWLAPHAVAAPVVGALAERARRTRLFHGCALALFGAAIATLALTVGRAPMVLTLVVALLGGSAGPVVTGGLSGLLATFTPEGPDRTRAYALDATTYNAAGVLAPAAVSTTAALLAPGPATALLAVSATAAALTTTALPTPHPTAAPHFTAGESSTAGESPTVAPDPGAGESPTARRHPTPGPPRTTGLRRTTGRRRTDASRPTAPPPARKAAAGTPGPHQEADSAQGPMTDGAQGSVAVSGAAPGTDAVSGRALVAESGVGAEAISGREPAAEPGPKAASIPGAGGAEAASSPGSATEPDLEVGTTPGKEIDAASVRAPAAESGPGSDAMSGAGAEATPGPESTAESGRRTDPTPGKGNGPTPGKGTGATSAPDPAAGPGPETDAPSGPATGAVGRDGDGFRGQLAAGVRVLWRVPALRAVTVATCVAFLGLGGLPVVAVLLAAQRGSAGGGGALLTAFAVGGLAGALGLARWRGAPEPRRLALGSLLATAVALAGTAAVPSFPLTVALFALAGLGDGPLLTATLRLRADHAPAAVRTQVFTLGAGLKLTAAAAGAALVGVFAWLPAAGLVLAVAALQLLAALLLRLLDRRARATRTGPVPDWGGEQTAGGIDG
ncbi:MFS transporter [Streptomyces albus]|uniref:MFS transporter n=1 Tax=Streptomyces albus TaxID=1888 RepID=UPI0024AD8D59|nr:MFS transporter [Streptomyces albus]MDI6408482.1 MFS transporter [Streptomyces albus]